MSSRKKTLFSFLLARETPGQGLSEGSTAVIHDLS